VRRARIAAAALACAVALPAGAQLEHWTEVGASAEIARGVRAGAEQELRFARGVVDAIRPGAHLSWRAARWLSLRLGYRYEVEPHFTKGADYADAWHEAYLDATLRRKLDRLRLSLRLRLEERRGRPWDEDGALVRTRAARQRLRAEWPLWRAASLVGSGELFLRIADPDGVRDKWRAGGGLALGIGAHEVSLQYLREEPLRAGGEPADAVALSYEFTP
jgi:hypothetical protein